MSEVAFLSGSTPASPPRITWVQPPGSFLALSLINGALRILTLGVYHFWGKTEVRQSIWSAVRVDGEPLEYRGTGGELFRGFMIVFAIVLLPTLIVGFLVTFFVHSQTGSGSYTSVFWALFFLLSGFGIHRARRYRLSRTRWRGIRAGLTGKSSSFAWTYLWTTILIPMTLGWIVPWRAVRLHSILFNDTHFGDKAFVFNGRSGSLYRRFTALWLGTGLLWILSVSAVSLGIALTTPRTAQPVSPPHSLTPAQIGIVAAVAFVALLLFAMLRGWYSARVINYLAANTHFGGASFKLEAYPASLVWLAASNYLMRFLSLGILTPIAEMRAIRYVVERLSLDRGVPLDQVGQNPDALLRYGEGLAEAFNVDAF
jgi:uncharacterized membrane protein YjgN (DUF898 family)